MAYSSTQQAITQLKPLLLRAEQDARPVALMLCGMCGSGKSTLAKAITEKFPSFVRLSIDLLIEEKHGLFRTDYPDEMYGEHQSEARQEFKERLLGALDSKTDVVLDRAFFDKEDRDAFRKIVREKGGRLVLVYLKPKNKELIWQRIRERRLKPRTADSAFDVTRELFDQWWDGFDIPNGEGEIVINVE